MSERSAELTDCVRAYSGPHHKGERKYMDFWERLFARTGRRKTELSAEAKCAEEWDTELASELSETEREQLKKAGCIRKHIYFSGRVQAVGFRYSALCLAKELQLTGWVKNLTDGRVEAELQGQAKLVDSFVERISQRGRIVVEFVEEEDRELCYEEGFEVR